MNRILIVRLGAVGDGLMLAPGLASLRRAQPAARIDLAGIAWRLRLLVGPTLADAVRPLDDFFRGDEADADELATYDRIIVFAIDLDEHPVRELARAAPDRVELHQSFPICRASETHVIDHIQQALAGCGVEPPAERHYRLPVPDDARRAAAQFLARWPGREPRVYLHPGTRIATKQWPAERFVALCRELSGRRGWQVFIGCGPLDEATVRPIEQGLADVDFVVVRGQDLILTAAVVERMDLCIGVDSGITHLASLVGTPTLALFGPTRPALWGPVGPRVQVLVGSRDRDCCQDDHPRTCDGGCMEEISIDRVLDAAEAMRREARG